MSRENFSAYRTAFVFVQNIYCGKLSETDSGYTFSYDEEYLEKPDAVPVSLTLPLSNQSYESKTLFPFFDGLIPEGWLLNAVSRSWKIDRKDRFGLLLAACKDSVGDVTIKNSPEDL